MSDTLWQEWFADDRKARAARLDGEALASPMQASSTEVELAEKLADMLGYEHDLTKHIRWLLEKCGGDHEGLRAVLTAKAHDHDWLTWVWDNDVGIYPVRAMLEEAYHHREAQESKQRFENTTAGRRAKYAGGKYEGLIQV